MEINKDIDDFCVVCDHCDSENVSVRLEADRDACTGQGLAVLEVECQDCGVFTEVIIGE